MVIFNPFNIISVVVNIAMHLILDNILQAH